MNRIEREAMDFLLTGDHPALATLRDQLRVSSVAERESTGVGFFTTVHVPSDAPRLDCRKRITIGDVYAEISGLAHGAGFVLFIENGALKLLECYIFESAWPSDPERVRFFYMRPRTRGESPLVETTERDLEWAISGLAS
jgi:hypothetical protein